MQPGSFLLKGRQLRAPLSRTGTAARRQGSVFPSNGRDSGRDGRDLPGVLGRIRSWPRPCFSRRSQGLGFPAGGPKTARTDCGATRPVIPPTRESRADLVEPFRIGRTISVLRPHLIPEQCPSDHPCPKASGLQRPSSYPGRRCCPSGKRRRRRRTSPAARHRKQQNS